MSQNVPLFKKFGTFFARLNSSSVMTGTYENNPMSRFQKMGYLGHPMGHH
jgi:hypothetical protein